MNTLPMLTGWGKSEVKVDIYTNQLVVAMKDLMDTFSEIESPKDLAILFAEAHDGSIEGLCKIVLIHSGRDNSCSSIIKTLLFSVLDDYKKILRAKDIGDYFGDRNLYPFSDQGFETYCEVEDFEKLDFDNFLNNGNKELYQIAEFIYVRWVFIDLMHKKYGKSPSLETCISAVNELYPNTRKTP